MRSISRQAMRSKALILNTLKLLGVGFLFLFLSCASDKQQGEDGMDVDDFATLGEEGAAADELGALETANEMDADDLEFVEGDESNELSELESELSGGSGESEQIEEVASSSGSGDGGLDELLEGGGEVSPERVDDGNFMMSSGRTVVSQTPQIPAEAFEKGGALLNRFYFLRSGDTWEGVSELIYGNSSRATSLQTWNGRKLYAGKLVYYESPVDRSDSNMRSLFDEKGIQGEPYQMQRGEFLSLIAKQRYGDIRSWKEIAVLNGVTSPDELKVGSQLTLYPANLAGGYSESVAQAPPQPEPEPEPEPQMTEPIAQEELSPLGTNEAQIEPIAPPPPPVIEPEPQYTPPPPPIRAATRPKKKFSTARMLQQNMFAFAIVGIIVVLLASLFVLNKRKKAALANDDLLDEGFAPPPKAGRR